MHISPLLLPIELETERKHEVFDAMHQSPERAEDESHLEVAHEAQMWGEVILRLKKYLYSINVNTHFDLFKLINLNNSRGVLRVLGF